MTTTEQLKDVLGFFTGSECLFRNIMGIKYTQGIQAMAQAAEAYWLIDLIGGIQHEDDLVRQEPFQAWTLAVPDGAPKTAVLTMTDGGKADNDPKPIYTQHINYTDFPEGVWKFWLVDGVLMLPSEY